MTIHRNGEVTNDVNRGEVGTLRPDVSVRKSSVRARTASRVFAERKQDPHRFRDQSLRVDKATDQPVAVYCAYGFHVGCDVATTLRERGIDARYIRGGVCVVRGRRS